MRRCAPCTGPARPQLRIPAPKIKLGEDEKKLCLALARDLNRLTVLIAESPTRCPPEKSVAAALITSLSRLSESSQRRVVDNARKSNVSAGKAAGLDLQSSLLQDWQRALRERLAGLKPDLEAAIDRAISQDQPSGRASPTKVDLKLAGEIDTTWRREINIASPETLDFRWSTAESGATRAYWELRGPVWLGLGNPGSVIASGYLPDFPNDDKIGGYFTVALHPHLPPTAPQIATTYHMRVLPLGTANLSGWTTSSDFEFTLQQGGWGLSTVQGGSEAPVGVGPWSAPAVIRYGKTFQSSIPDFAEDMNREVYRKAHFYFDGFKLVKDQPGSGNEEFHISGFVVEHNPQGSVHHASIGPMWFQIDPDDRSLHPMGKRAVVNLGTPNRTYWPRVLTALISIMEEDDGGSLTEWQEAIVELLHDLMVGQAGADVGAFMREMRDRIEQAQQDMTAALTGEMFSVLLAGIAATVREFVTAFIALAIGLVAASIAAGAEDDFYGTKVLAMFLATNETQRIADGSAGDLSGSGVVHGGTFTGSAQPDGSFRMDLTEIQFLGLGSANEGSPISGIAHILLHWEFDDKVWV